jgi:hypothetical protein
MGNYFFLFISTFLITILGTFITNKIVEPHLGTYKELPSENEDESLTHITERERKGIRNAALVASLYIAAIILSCLPSDSFMRNANGELFGSPSSTLVNGVVILITFLFMLPGIAYGKTVGTFTKENGICEAMSKSMSSMGSFLALAFVSAQFINYFNYHNTLSYAWEKSNKVDIELAIKNRVHDTEDLIIIGYSFPYVNDKIDRNTISNMPSLKRVYIQDPNFEDIKERIESMLPENQKVEFIQKGLKQFYIPSSFN